MSEDDGTIVELDEPPEPEPKRGDTLFSRLSNAKLLVDDVNYEKRMVLCTYRLAEGLGQHWFAFENVTAKGPQHSFS